MAESLYQGKMDWGITNDLKVQKGMSNAPVLDVELVNGATYTINTAELRGKDSNGGAIAKESLGQNSFHSFAVSDDKYAAQTFGYVYNKANDKGGSDKQAVAFSVGQLTPETDAVLKPASKDSLKYSGDAYIDNNTSYQPIVKGTSNFDVSFFDKKITGKLEFTNRAIPGKGGDVTAYPTTIELTDSTITGNTFSASGKTSDGYDNDVSARGQFYGEGAAELGGIFQTGSMFSSSIDGSFGAVKQAGPVTPPKAANLQGLALLHTAGSAKKYAGQQYFWQR